MINMVFAVYDAKAGYYMNPFVMRSKGEAVRGFKDIANDKEHEIGKHPEDYTLFHLGNFNCENGKYELNATPCSLGVAIEYVDKNEIKEVK